MIDFSTLQGLTIPEGVVTQIAKDGVVLWSAKEPEIQTLYLRPSADISINHTLYPTSSTSAYLLISEEVPDDSSTRIQHTITAGDSSTYSVSSSFKFICANLPQKYKIKSAKLVIKYSTNASGAVGIADLTGFENTAIITNGAETKTYTINKRYTDSIEAIWGTYCTDITDYISNKSLSSGFSVELKQSCSDCTTSKTESGTTKTYNTAVVGITTAWIEVEYV